jgi:hypothetical protein
MSTRARRSSVEESLKESEALPCGTAGVGGASHTPTLETHVLTSTLDPRASRYSVATADLARQMVRLDALIHQARDGGRSDTVERLEVRRQSFQEYRSTLLRRAWARARDGAA